VSNRDDAYERPQAGATPAGRYDGDGNAGRTSGRRINVRWVNLLLLVPLIGVLVPQFYNRRSPEWGGMPFFYWYQLVWIPVSVTFTWYVYRATRGDR
jgi:Protein of unknown function (DUF3311)